MKKATDARGKFDVLQFFANHQKTFPVHYVLALIFFGVLNSEANVERVFSYAGGVMSSSRASLSALMLEAMVIVAKNADSFPFTTEELYDKYCDLYATPMRLTLARPRRRRRRTTTTTRRPERPDLR